jgi:S-adenosylmethionine:tRNA ribosyltransferase-isomerase
VGYGTFKPVRSTTVEEHVVDPERYFISPESADAINGALDEGRRIVTVGTTTTRAVEDSAVRGGGRVVAGPASATLFIYPGFRFQVAGGLITNFHLPRSSLLMLVAAFAGRERILAAYRTAVEQRYRFYSYGDAMLIL